MLQITITIFGTITSGVIVFVVSQLIIQKYVKPYEEYKLLKSNVAFVLVMYANLYCNPRNKAESISDELKEKYNLASNETRRMAAEISAFRQRIVSKRKGIPSDKSLEKAESELVRLSNSYFLSPVQDLHEESKSNRESAKNIIKLLSIDIVL